MRVFLGLGSNLGDRAHYLGEAIAALASPMIKVRATSSIYETEPWGVMDQPLYWNQVIKACVTQDKYQLIERLAEEIAQQVLEQFSCTSVRVEVHKPQAPIPGIFKDVSVEMWREAGARE